MFNLTSPMLWLAVSGWLAVGGTYVFKEIQRGKDYRAAYVEGKAAGLGSASTAGAESANQTLTIIREAEAATPLVVDEAAKIALCCARTSCRNRARLMQEGKCR